MKYSNKTIAELYRALWAVVNTNAELDNLFLEFGLSYNQFDGGIQPHSSALVSTLCERSDADDALTRVVEYVLERYYPSWAPTDRLLQSLRLDGFEWRKEKLIPTTPQPAALAKELSQFERDLQDLLLNVAAEHYRQAHESFTASNWEAANGQIRCFMENLLIEFGKRETSKTRSDPSAALQDLREQNFIDNPEWQMFRGFWQAIQDNGPHHGLSHEQEALFRLHGATSIALTPCISRGPKARQSSGRRVPPNITLQTDRLTTTADHKRLGFYLFNRGEPIICVNSKSSFLLLFC